MKKGLKIFAFCFVLWLSFFRNDEMVVKGASVPAPVTTAAQVTISASLGEPILKLWGYGPPNSRIELSGEAVADFAYSRTDGYYEFPKAYLPSPTDLLYPELCVTAIDPIGRASVPTCIPPLPTTRFSYDVGPVILPPTLSLDEGSVVPSSQSGAEGVTIPNSEVKIVLAEDSNSQKTSKYSIVGTAYAYYIPDYTVKSDEHGYFSFNMPAASPKTWNVFAITSYSQGATSPKSNTLKFEVVSPISAAVADIWTFLLSLLTLPVLIIFELLVVILIIIAVILSKNRKKKLPPNTSNPIEEYQNYLKSKQII